MDYVIYGIGYRGKRLFNYIKNKNVLAFIDFDTEKQGYKYYGKPVISLEEYKKKYVSAYIIVTPAYSNNIDNILQENGIYQYTNLVDMPSEFAGYGECQFENCYINLKRYNNNLICIYGLNALSFLVYDFFEEKENISICPGEGCDSEKIEWVKKYHPEIKIKDYNNVYKDEIILISEIEKEEQLFLNKSFNLFEYASGNKQYWNKRLLEIKNTYKDEKCFIVATGPSLCMEDLRTLTINKVFCFGVNSIIEIKEKWVADAYVATDSNFISNNIESIGSYKCKYKFIGDAYPEYWKKAADNEYKIHVITAGKAIDFSEEICQKIYCGYCGRGTVTYTCLQLAVYMGFTEIYLLGVDCNYTMGSKDNYFIKNMVQDNKNHREDLMIQAYIFAKKYADSHGIKIYNATRGGMLEVFERVNFDSLFKIEK